jgi:hypothetical protein
VAGAPILTVLVTHVLTRRELARIEHQTNAHLERLESEVVHARDEMPSDASAAALRRLTEPGEGQILH